MLRATLSNIMSEDIVVVSEDTKVGQAAHLLLRFRINGILVVKKGDKKKVKGVLTTTDLLGFLDKAFSGRIFAAEKLKTVANLPVGAIAGKTVLKVQKDAEIGKVISLMHKKRIHTIPVYDGKKLVGVVGKHDIINAAFA
ncbi:MAG: CBS domain-containing protein [Candidatus Omnitrophota bacterium]|nr:CBS domain-containing protein [Candidatus Omnitrophota bacterium]